MALSVVNLGVDSFNNGSDGGTTGSVKPTNGRLLITASPTPPGACPAVSLSGGGVTTWTQFATVAHGTTTNQRKIWLFRAYQASYGSAAAVTITATSATSTAWIVFDVAGIDTSGTNGSGAIVQSPTNTGTTQTTTTVTMSSFGDATNNGAFGFVTLRWGGGTPSITEDSAGGYAGNGGLKPPTPPHSLETEWKSGEDTSIPATTSGSSGWGMIGVEIKAASAGTSASVSPSASLSPSASASRSLSPSASASRSVSPSASLSPSASASRSVSPSASLSPSASASLSLSPSTSASASVSPSASISPSASLSPSASASASLSPSASASASLSPSASVSPSASASASLSPSASASA